MPDPLTAPSRTPGGRPRAAALIVVLPTVAFLGVVCTFGFTNAEDQGLITENPNLNPPTLRGLWNHWREPHLFVYIPATYTAWWLVAQIARTSTPDETGATLNPWLFHALNLSLHATSAVLVLGLLRRLIGRDGPAIVGALVFALHPIQVEPAAWTTGTKDVQCGAWSFAALLLYLRCAQQPPAASSPAASGRRAYIVGSI